MQGCKELKRKSTFSSWLVNLYQSLEMILSQANELKIWQKVDRQGKNYWKVYDPITNRTMQFNSEEEVRMWIDRCYYR